MNRTTRRLAGGLAIIGAGATLIGPITALAQSDDDAPPSSDLPATPDEEVAAPREWLAEVLQPLIDAGTLTQVQADAVTEALRAARPDVPVGRHHGGPGFGRHGRVGLETAATTIGITTDALREALEGGQTLAEVATANGVQPQAVVDALVAEARSHLEEAVADGRIDQAEADERLTSLTELITRSVEEGFPTRGPGPGGFPGRPRDDDTPIDDGSTPTTEAPATTEGGS